MHRDAQRFIARELEGAGLGGARDLPRIIARHLGIIPENRCAIGKLTDGFWIGLSHLAGHQFGAVAEVRPLNGVSNFMQQSGA